MNQDLLLAAIGRALGQDGPYQERSSERQEEINPITGWIPPRDASLQVLGGAIGADGRVAWIEEVVHGAVPRRQARGLGDAEFLEDVEEGEEAEDGEELDESDESGDELWVHSSIQLRAISGGREHPLGRTVDDEPAIGLEIPSYNVYFGCQIYHMAWLGDSVVTVYREKHETLVWSVPLVGEARLATASDAVIVRGDELYFLGEEPGILIGIALSDLAPLVPVPTRTTTYDPELELQGDTVVLRIPGWHTGAEEDVEVERLTLPERGVRLDPAEVLALVPRVVDELMALGPARRPAEVLVGAVLSPFYLPRLRVRTRYHALEPPWATPHWLPAHWYVFLVREGRSAEAAAHLQFLDAVAELPAPMGSDPLWTTATRHVIQRARLLAEVCRAGQLPSDWGDRFWYDGRGAFRRKPPPGAPRGLLDAIQEMRPNPPSLPERRRGG